MTNTLQVDGLVRITGLTQARYKTHPCSLVRWNFIALWRSTCAFYAKWKTEKDCAVLAHFVSVASARLVAVSPLGSTYTIYLCCREIAISIHQIVHGFTPPPVQNQYVKQGTGGRYSVAEDGTSVVLVISPEM